MKLHSKRVEKMRNYAPNEWRRCETTLERSGEDVKLHSKRVYRFLFSGSLLNIQTQAVYSFTSVLKVEAGENGNLQSYWTTTKLWKLAVVLDHYEAMET